MDMDARHQACEEFHVKLRRHTGVNLDAFVCSQLLGYTFESVLGREQVSLQGNPGGFYMGLGAEAYTRPLSSSTCVSALHGMGGTRSGCVAPVKGC
jgi:hypothetical protein